MSGQGLLYFRSSASVTLGKTLRMSPAIFYFRWAFGTTVYMTILRFTRRTEPNFFTKFIVHPITLKISE